MIKANGNNDENVCKIDLMDSDSKTYKATIEVRMGFDYIDRYGYENDDGVWYMAERKNVTIEKDSLKELKKRLIKRYNYF